ncbi:MAG: DUF5681 domain-containing protein [Hyphomicrobium sp.]
MYDDDGSGRDRNGRWRKGHCPNQKGRPRKKPEVSQADVNQFKETLVDAVIQGKPTQMTRHELLLHKMYEQALKGSVLIQRKLFDRFEQSDDTFEEAEFHLRHLGKQIVAHHDKTGKIDERLYDEYRRLYYLLRRREHHEAVNEPRRRPRNRTKATPITPTWRKGPKPQAILDLEREWAEAEAAARARKDDDTDES